MKTPILSALTCANCGHVTINGHHAPTGCGTWSGGEDVCGCILFAPSQPGTAPALYKQALSAWEHARQQRQQLILEAAADQAAAVLYGIVLRPPVELLPDQVAPYRWTVTTDPTDVIAPDRPAASATVEGLRMLYTAGGCLYLLATCPDPYGDGTHDQRALIADRASLGQALTAEPGTGPWWCPTCRQRADQEAAAGHAKLRRQARRWADGAAKTDPEDHEVGAMKALVSIAYSLLDEGAE